MIRKLTFLAVSAVIAFGALSFDLPQSTEDPGDRLIGIWEPSNGRSRIKIDRIGNKYYGRVVWLIEPNDADGNPRPSNSINIAVNQRFKLIEYLLLFV